MQKITPCLWFDNNAQEAMHFYVSVFKNSKILSESKMMSVFELDGLEIQALNGGPEFNFTEAISLSVKCKDQAEVDEYWNKLTADGGEESQCGWLKDKYGLSWQIVPNILGELMSKGDKEKSQRMMQALMGMKKLVVADLQKAYNG